MSITLTTPYTVSISGTQVENDTVGACSGMSVDYISVTMTYIFKVGTLAGSPSNLNAGPIAQREGKTILVTVYLGATNENGNGWTQGQWWLNGTLQSTIISLSILNPIITQVLANRNTAEGFVAVSGGLMPGTQVPWTQL